MRNWVSLGGRMAAEVAPVSGCSSCTAVPAELTFATTSLSARPGKPLSGRAWCPYRALETSKIWSGRRLTDKEVEGSTQMERATCQRKGTKRGPKKRQWSMMP